MKFNKIKEQKNWFQAYGMVHLIRSIPKEISMFSRYTKYNYEHLLNDDFLSRLRCAVTMISYGDSISKIIFGTQFTEYQAKYLYSRYECLVLRKIIEYGYTLEDAKYFMDIDSLDRIKSIRIRIDSYNEIEDIKHMLMLLEKDYIHNYPSLNLSNMLNK